jgi:hypothetical protein
LKPSAPKPKQPVKVNGTSKQSAINLDSDDEEPVPTVEFEHEEEELDPAQPYPSVVQQIRLPLNTDVLHIAVPALAPPSDLQPADTTPPIFGRKIVFAIACADYSVRVVSLPLNPPPDAVKAPSSSGKLSFGEEITSIPIYAGHQDIPRGVSVTWTSQSELNQKEPSDDEMDVDGDATAAPARRSPRKKQARSRSIAGEATGFELLVASHTDELGGLLNIWRFTLTEASVKISNPVSPYHTITLHRPATRVVFNKAQYPKSRHSQLLITDKSGTARIFDPFAARDQRAGVKPSKRGAFIASFKTGFENTKTTAPPILATRKAIVDATWVSDGHHVLALLADGEWGVWDVNRSGPSPPADPYAFSLRGFVGISDNERASDDPSSPKARTGRNSLAPMTPNTRQKKVETLFHSSLSNSPIPPRGGISVASSSASQGEQVEDSVVMWYGAEVHRIPDLAKFWARTVTGSKGNSLPGPGLLHLQDLSMLGEAITSVGQFRKETRTTVPRDILIAGEHRLVIATTTPKEVREGLSANSARERAEEEDAKKADNALLIRGELDLGGMDRLLGDMEGSDTRNLVLGNPRKVLFASSTA